MRVGGLASGMDTESIVKDMMKIQKMPLDKLMQQKVFTEWQQEAFRDTNLAFSNLRTSAGELRFQSSFNSYSATKSSNTGNANVTTTANAMSGSYEIEVLSIASAAKLNSANPIQKQGGGAALSSDTIGAAGKITINGSGTVDVTIDITADMTYSQVAKKLQDATIGKVPELRASFDDTTSRFFMTTKGMGEAQNFSLEFKSADGTATNPALAQQITNNGATATDMASTVATNGRVKLDGIEIGGLTSNKTTVNGLTIELLQVHGTDAKTTVTVQSNPEKPLAMIKDFVGKYNEMIATIEKQLVEKRYPDFQPLSDEQKKDLTENEIELWEEKARSGLLRNDPVLKRAMQDLRRAFMEPVAGIDPGNINVLSEIGINTGAYTEGGKLIIDETKLSAALTNNPDEVMELFTKKNAAGNGVGIGEKIYKELNNITDRLSAQAGRASGSTDNSTLSKKIKQMNDEISRWQDRLTRVEDRYWKQFTAMEKALSQMNSQSTWMQQNMFGGA